MKTLPAKYFRKCIKYCSTQEIPMNFRKCIELSELLELCTRILLSVRNSINKKISVLETGSVFSPVNVVGSF
jgi:hypothetical protein